MNKLKFGEVVVYVVYNEHQQTSTNLTKSPNSLEGLRNPRSIKPSIYELEYSNWIKNLGYLKNLRNLRGDNMSISSIIPITTHVAPTQTNTIKPTPPNGYQKVKKTDKGDKSKDTSEDTKENDYERSDDCLKHIIDTKA